MNKSIKIGRREITVDIGDSDPRGNLKYYSFEGKKWFGTKLLGDLPSWIREFVAVDRRNVPYYQVELYDGGIAAASYSVVNEKISYDEMADLAIRSGISYRQLAENGVRAGILPEEVLTEIKDDTRLDGDSVHLLITMKYSLFAKEEAAKLNENKPGSQDKTFEYVPESPKKRIESPEERELLKKCFELGLTETFAELWIRDREYEKIYDQTGYNWLRVKGNADLTKTVSCLLELLDLMKRQGGGEISYSDNSNALPVPIQRMTLFSGLPSYSGGDITIKSGTRSVLIFSGRKISAKEQARLKELVYGKDIILLDPDKFVDLITGTKYTWDTRIESGCYHDEERSFLYLKGLIT